MSNHACSTKLEFPGGIPDTDHAPEPVEFFELVWPAPKVPIREIAQYEGGHLFEEIDVRVSPRFRVWKRAWTWRPRR
ncbi:MAG: hypothetical protein JRG89_06285 [Deltaproteobacteria bacterium]|nr:hypothetical protein [Deltaproteobacteria bacterium]MBW2388028.1 hypothetical protein [Deltaproteobacteria bacterium]